MWKLEGILHMHHHHHVTNDELLGKRKKIEGLRDFSWERTKKVKRVDNT